MSAGKNIEIKIATTGGDQAAAEIRKVEEAAKGASSGNGTGFGGQLDGTVARNEAHEKRLAQIAAEGEALEGLGKIAEKETADEIKDMESKEAAAAKYAKELDEQTEKASAPSKVARMKEVALATGAIGLAAGAAAKTVGQIKTALESVDTAQLRAVDSAMADNIESAKNWAMALEDPIGALLKLTTGETVASAFDGLNDQLKRNAEMTSDAVDRFIKKSAIQVEKIEKQAAALKAANALLDAKAETAATERAGKNAERIRNGEAPEDVAAEEAKIQAAEKIAKIERDQEESRIGLQEKYDASIAAAAAARDGEAAGGRIDAAQNKYSAAEDALKTDMFTSQTVLEKRRDAARRELEETKQRDGVAAGSVKGNQEAAAAARKAFEEQKIKIAQEDAIANERKANIRAGANNTVMEAGVRKSDRLAEEQRTWKDVGAGPRDAFLQEREKQRREQASEESLAGGSLTQGAFDSAKKARGMGAPSKGIEALEKAAGNLSRDPGNSGYQQATEALLEKVVNWLEENGQGDTADTAKIRELERKFERLQASEQQLRRQIKFQ